MRLPARHSVRRSVRCNRNLWKSGARQYNFLLPCPPGCAAFVSRFRGHVAQQSSTDDYFVIRFGAELEPPAGDFRGDHPYVERLQRRNPWPQRRFLGI